MSQPKPGDQPVLWYLDTKPRFYRPYLIRVLKRNDTFMQFVFLDGHTGAELALSKPSYEIAYHDGRYAYSALPSTAQKAQPGSTRDCGLLFISDLYIQDLPRADGAALLVAVRDDKWPRSAGRLFQPSTQPEAAPEKVAPGKAAPGKAAPRKAAPGKAAPRKAAPGKAARGHTGRARARRSAGRTGPKRRAQGARGRAAD